MTAPTAWASAAAVALTVVAGCGSGHGGPGFEQLSGGGGATAEGSESASVATGSASGSSSGGGGTRMGPPYPIVLAHGFFGFDTFAGLDFATYFFEVREHLAEHGERMIYTPAVDPFNSSEYRGAQLADEIEAVLTATGHDKVNIIGHSQGGLDARVVAHDHPERVASVVSLQTPHLGTPIADIVLELVADESLQDLLDLVVQLVATPLYDQVGGETSVAAPLHLFSEPGIAAFNAAYPDSAGVYYASIAGRSDGHAGGTGCQAASLPPFVAAFGGTLDPIDALFAVSESLLDGGWAEPYPNDGLVRVDSARHGEFLGCLPADHLDMVGQLFGDGPGGGNNWDYRQFYLELVAWLRSKGY